MSLEPDMLVLELSADEVEILAELPVLLESLTPGEEGAARLGLAAYPDDPRADAEFRRLMSDELERARAADRSAFRLALEDAAAATPHLLRGSTVEVRISTGEADAWLRVLAEARLLLGYRLGITAEDDHAVLAGERNPTHALLDYLAWLQASLSHALMERMDAV